MATSTSPNPQIKFGEQEFTDEELFLMRRKLEEKIDAKHISYRKGHDGGGQQVPYLETNKAISFANEIFGYGGWASQVVNLSVDYIEETNDHKFNSGVSAIVRIQLKDGTYHEDIGYGSADRQRNKAVALELAKKSAVSDGIKRALRCFGNALGNSMSDKEHLKNVKSNPGGKPPVKQAAPYGSAQPTTTYNNNNNNNQQQQQQQQNHSYPQNNNNNSNFANRNFNDNSGGMSGGNNNFQNTNNNQNTNNISNNQQQQQQQQQNNQPSYANNFNNINNTTGNNIQNNNNQNNNQPNNQNNNNNNNTNNQNTFQNQNNNQQQNNFQNNTNFDDDFGDLPFV